MEGGFNLEKTAKNFFIRCQHLLTFGILHFAFFYVELIRNAAKTKLLLVLTG